MINFQNLLNTIPSPYGVEVTRALADITNAAYDRHLINSVPKLSIPSRINVSVSSGTLTSEILDMAGYLTPSHKRVLEDSAALFTVINNEPWIFINSDIDLELLGSLIRHELVHYDQWLRGDLVIDGNKLYWLGELYSDSQPTNDLTIELCKPWEREAYAKMFTDTELTKYLEKLPNDVCELMIDALMEFNRDVPNLN